MRPVPPGPRLAADLGAGQPRQTDVRPRVPQSARPAPVERLHVIRECHAGGICHRHHRHRPLPHHRWPHPAGRKRLQLNVEASPADRFADLAPAWGSAHHRAASDPDTARHRYCLDGCGRHRSRASSATRSDRIGGPGCAATRRQRVRVMSGLSARRGSPPRRCPPSRHIQFQRVDPDRQRARKARRACFQGTARGHRDGPAVRSSAIMPIGVGRPLSPRQAAANAAPWTRTNAKVAGRARRHGPAGQRAVHGAADAADPRRPAIRTTSRRCCGPTRGCLDRTGGNLDGGADPLPWLLRGIDGPAAAGCGAIAIPCNTAHGWYDEMSRRAEVPILHIVDAAARGTASLRHRRWHDRRDGHAGDAGDAALPGPAGRAGLGLHRADPGGDGAPGQLRRSPW